MIASPLQALPFATCGRSYGGIGLLSQERAQLAIPRRRVIASSLQAVPFATCGRSYGGIGLLS